ncbi:predicted protein [Chaetomium globosum CBS 148.51]|uniref:Uncharacterized protein n=1 Tax=Chaetomium globosum (strain ATCC 6205 / CBS 148.51 / DSM 1962 / NBRC 6347 / NRRL 1970) TaxID=306901 RepID=Q2GRX4_CHAGB|nr:uncharacterized protein CHGG_09280 [Chaetomium globosum CBS 148.51]EAQ85266.1 predicted protein [Chaetomium globosum CBS 148.51]
MSSTTPTATPTPQVTDIFGHFRELNYAACVPGIMGTRCNIFWALQKGYEDMMTSRTDP